MFKAAPRQAHVETPRDEQKAPPPRTEARETQREQQSQDKHRGEVAHGTLRDMLRTNERDNVWNPQQK